MLQIRSQTNIDGSSEKGTRRNDNKPASSSCFEIYRGAYMVQKQRLTNAGRQTLKHARYWPALVVLSFVSVFMCATTALAQFTTARLSGTVTDHTNAAVPGATVTVEQSTTGYRQTTKTGASGDYLFPSLPVGTYDLTVEMTGFATYAQKGVVLNVGQSATQNVPLVVGSVSQQITVRENASLVTTDDPTVGQLIGQTSIVGLPLNGREAQQLVFLTPGAVDVSALNCGANCEGGVLPGEQYAKVNGGGANGVYYLLDG